MSERRMFPALYCVDNDRFDDSARGIDPITARRRFGLRSDSIVFLFSGKLVDKKHPLELIAAVRTAVRDGANLECLIVGDGQLRQECEAYVRQFELPVRFAGFLNQSQIIDAYVASDCLVLPSNHGETWGLVVNEAMACGRPAIVSSQVGCAEDLVANGETGAVFKSGDWDHLAKILYQAASDPELLKTWGVAARTRIAAYSPKAAAQGVLHAIKSVSRKAIRA